jgi:outer membrane protein, heavy metal efflux system
LAGGSISLQIPIFHQNQAVLRRAQSRLEDARAREALLEAEIENSLALEYAQLQSARAMLEEYRQTLLPQRESAVLHSGEKVNFMLSGIFELLLIREQEFDSAQGYVETLRDYWLTRAALQRAVGARLPIASPPSEPSAPTEIPAEHHHSGATP